MTIDFSKIEDGEKMYEAFKNATLNSRNYCSKAGWSFQDESFTAILDWEAENW